MENERSLITQDNATAIYQRMTDPLDAITKMGQMFANSGMFGCSKVEQGQVLALACLIEGKSPFDLMRNYHIIGGNLSMKASAILAEFMKRGGKVKWKSPLNDVTGAMADFKIGDMELTDAVYTIEDATREGLVGGSNPNWKTRPAEMLRARLTTKAIRMIAPGIVMGIMDDSEAPGPAPAAPLLEQPRGMVAPIKGEFDFGASFQTDGVPEADINAFLIFKRMLGEGQTWVDLPPATVKKIGRNYPEFIVKVKDFAGTKEPANA